jgi:hypothetical protein
LKSLIIKNYYRCLGLYSLKDEFSRLTGTYELNTLRKTPKPEEIVSLITDDITNGTIFQNNQSMLLSEDKNKSQDEINEMVQILKSRKDFRKISEMDFIITFHYVRNKRKAIKYQIDRKRLAITIINS